MAPEDIPTQPHDFKALMDDPAWQLPAADEGSVVDQIEDHLPSPYQVRAVALALAGVVAAAVGRQVDITPWLDAVLSAYTIVIPTGLSLWLGRKAQKAKAAATPST